jgi:hypothetical protein
MSYFEVCLKLGDWLTDDDRRAMYDYLLSTRRKQYILKSETLLKENLLKYSIANGIITFYLDGEFVLYSAQSKVTEEMFTDIRKLKLSKIPARRNKQISRFFAQAEVDVISNFPLPGIEPQSSEGYGVNNIPFYNIEYFSNGNGRLLGLYKKLRTDNSELVRKMAS